MEYKMCMCVCQWLCRGSGVKRTAHSPILSLRIGSILGKPACKHASGRLGGWVSATQRQTHLRGSCVEARLSIRTKAQMTGCIQTKFSNYFTKGLAAGCERQFAAQLMSVYHFIKQARCTCNRVWVA